MPPSPPAVAVVIPVWNRATLVIACLESVRAQMHPPAEVVIVDDGSTDATADAVATWIHEHRAELPAQLVRKDNAGAAAARNLGLSMIGEPPLVAFLDSDDAWPADFLARAAAALGSDPVAVAASADRLREDLRARTRTVDDLSNLAKDPVRWIFRHGAGIGSCTVFRAAAVRAAGGYPEHIATGHDSVLFCRVAAMGRWLHCAGDPVMFLRHHSHVTGQADHVCLAHPDHERLWARVYDELATELGPAHLPDAFRRKTVGRRWARAGAALRRLRRYRDAQECYLRALRLRPWSQRAWRGLLAASLFRVLPA